MAAGNDPHSRHTSGSASQDALRASQERFRLLVENTGDDFYLHDAQGRFQDVNQRACQSTGYTRDELLKMAVSDLSASHTPEETLAILAGTQPGTVSTVLAQHRRKDGSVFPVEVRVSCLLVNGEKLFLGMVRDVSERLEAQRKVEQLNAELEQRVQKRTQQLRRSSEQLAQAERLARIGSWSLDLATGEFTSSEMLYELNGADPAGPPLTTADLEHMMTPESHQKLSRAIGKCIQDGEPYALDVTHLRPDGNAFAAHIRGQGVRDADGKVISLNGTVQDVSEREEARLRLATLADNLPNGAIYRAEYGPQGDSGSMSYMSAGIEPMVGLRPEQLMADADQLLSCIHPDDVSHYQDSGRRSLASYSPYDCSFRVIKPDGDIAWLHCRSVATTVRPDGSSVWDGIIRDITQEHLAASALREAKETAEAAERAKADFLAMMSHEIRTPMNSVIGMSRLMLQTELNAKQRNYLTKIDMSAKALLAIINDILDFSKIEAGMLTLEDVDFDLDAVLEAVSAVTAVRAEEKSLELVYRIARPVPARLRGDPLRLGQILTNLIGNALKFTDRGCVVVDIDVAADSADPATLLQFNVRDTGIGLEPAQIARLFKPFSQADAQTSRRHGGTGLGLAICHRLVELMQGRIGVDSRSGEGSHFHFTARFTPPDANSPVEHPHSMMAALHGRRVLIVDDHADTRQALLELTHSLGLRATAVDGAAAAIDSLRDAQSNNQPYALALIDWHMPEMDGIALMRQIIDEHRLAAHQLVLMVTAHAQENVLLALDELGVKHLLFKPATATSLAQFLNEACSATDETPAVSAAQTGDISTALLGRTILVVDDHDLNREVASDFLELAGARVVTASNGAQAILCLQQQTFDAVLMDVQMPVMDGLMATHVIRRREQWRNLPIIALTAQARTEDRDLARAAGMDGHLTKPLDDQQLYATLLQILEGRAPSAPPTDADTAQPQLGSQPAALVDLADMQMRFNHRQDRIQRILHGFLQEFSGTPQRIEALWRQRELTQLAATVHMLKGSVGYLGAAALYIQAGQIELAADHKDLALLDALMPAFLASLQALLAELPISIATVAHEQDTRRRTS